MTIPVAPPYGLSIIAGQSGQRDDAASSIRATDPATNKVLEPPFHPASEKEIERAVAEATAAFDTYRSTTPAVRAGFLRAIADNLEAARMSLVDRAMRETGLPEARLNGELTRTTNQLRLFADELELGDHQGVRIDHAPPERQPTSAPDVRQRQIPLGPVLVFGASNFPFAFSTAGGDTASALAAGCPVVVKAHNSHAGAAELAAWSIIDAVTVCHLPAGVFSLVFGPGNSIGQQLAAHPGIKAIGFTGSRSGGTALMRTAAARHEPIPVYAEMSSINPVLVLPAAWQERGESIATGFVSSLTLGAGQFCTNPGVVFVPESFAEDVKRAVAEDLAECAGQTMLSTGIFEAYEHGIARLAETACTSRIAAGTPGQTHHAPAPEVYATELEPFLADQSLQEEVFGAASLIVTYRDVEQLRRGLELLQGQLTISLHAAPDDHGAVARLLPVLERKAGRLVMNDWPTGVEVNHAMVHGGPFPATTDSRSTSVGTAAILRFQRPVAYQGFIPELLPNAVAEENPWRLPRRVNGLPHLP